MVVAGAMVVVDEPAIVEVVDVDVLVVAGAVVDVEVLVVGGTVVDVVVVVV